MHSIRKSMLKCEFDIRTEEISWYITESGDYPDAGNLNVNLFRLRTEKMKQKVIFIIIIIFFKFSTKISLDFVSICL